MELRFSRAGIACLCVLAVLVVLITPAFDELPSTLPHLLQHGLVAGSAAIAPILMALASPLTLPTHFAASASIHDLLSLNCTRLC